MSLVAHRVISLPHSNRSLSAAWRTLTAGSLASLLHALFLSAMSHRTAHSCTKYDERYYR
jgi:hypothetical protein